MTASVAFLAVMVSVAVVVTGLTPLLLVYLWIKDRRKGRLW